MAAVLDDLKQGIVSLEQLILIDPLELLGKGRILGVRKPLLGPRRDRRRESNGEGETNSDADSNRDTTIHQIIHGATPLGWILIIHGATPLGSISLKNHPRPSEPDRTPTTRAS